MITYESLKELAHALSKVTGFRYIAFDSLSKYVFVVSASQNPMKWYAFADNFSKGKWMDVTGFNVYMGTNKVDENLDWSKCQFDCEEADNGTSNISNREGENQSD